MRPQGSPDGPWTAPGLPLATLGPTGNVGDVVGSRRHLLDQPGPAAGLQLSGGSGQDLRKQARIAPAPSQAGADPGLSRSDPNQIHHPVGAGSRSRSTQQVAPRPHNLSYVSSRIKNDQGKPWGSPGTAWGPLRAH